MRNHSALLILLAALGAYAFPAMAEGTLEGEITGVITGSAVKLKTEDGEKTVCLAKVRPSADGKKFLQEKCLGRQAKVTIEFTAPNGFVFGDAVLEDGSSLCALLKGVSGPAPRPHTSEGQDRKSEYETDASRQEAMLRASREHAEQHKAEKSEKTSTSYQRELAFENYLGLSRKAAARQRVLQAEEQERQRQLYLDAQQEAEEEAKERPQDTWKALGNCALGERSMWRVAG